jgi:tetratricopeptide (TPR) repeat protein
MAGVASAGPAEEERAMALAQARDEAEAAERRGDHAACAAAWLRAFDIDSRQLGDELLYNAGVCFEEDAAVEPALDAWSRLERRFPRSRLRPRAIARRANLLARVARYEEAAAALEEYAGLYGGERDAREAMSDAALYRRALGQHRRAIDLTRRWLKTWKHTPGEEAQALLFVAAVQDDMGDRRAAIASLESAARLAARDRELAEWIRARLAALKNPRPREKSSPLPERYEQRGVMADILWTAPLAP